VTLAPRFKARASASQAIAANAPQEVAKLGDHSGNVDATLLADEVTIHNLSQQLADKFALLGS